MPSLCCTTSELNACRAGLGSVCGTEVEGCATETQFSGIYRSPEMYGIGGIHLCQIWRRNKVRIDRTALIPTVRATLPNRVSQLPGCEGEYRSRASGGDFQSVYTAITLTFGT